MLKFLITASFIIGISVFPKTGSAIDTDLERLSLKERSGTASRDTTQGVGDFFHDIGQKLGLFNRCLDDETKIQCRARRDQEKHVRKQRRILERRGFEINISDKERQNVMERISSFNGKDSCEFGKSIPRARRLAHYDEILSDMMPAIIENYSESCLTSLATYYQDYKTSRENPADHKYCQENQCELVGERLSLFDENYVSLTSRLNSLEEAKSANCIVRAPVDLIEPSLNVEQILEELPQIAADLPEINREPSSITVSLPNPGAQSCPSPEIIEGMKAKILMDQLKATYLLCENQWSGHQGLASYKNQNQNEFKSAEGIPITGNGPLAHAYSFLIINKIHRQHPELVAASDDYFKRFGPLSPSSAAGFQARESIGTSILNVSMAEDLQEGSRANHCRNVANQMTELLNENNEDNFLDKVNSHSFANNPEVWRRVYGSNGNNSIQCDISVE